MVAEIEDLGYGNLWLTDSSLHSRYCWAYLTLAARRTSRLMIGTAVTNPVTRHPALTATAAATLAEISGGRAILGIGAGDRPLLSLGHQPARLATLAASIAAIRALWAGASLDTVQREHRHTRVRAARRALPVPARPGHPGVRVGHRPAHPGTGRPGRRRGDPAGRAAPGRHLVRAGAHRPGRRRGRPGAPARDRVRLRLDRRGRAGGYRRGPHHRRLVPADRAGALPAGRAAPGNHRPGPRQLRGRRVPGSGPRRRGAAGQISSSGWRWPAAGPKPASTCAHWPALGVDSVTVFPLGADRMATVRAFAECAQAELTREGAA